MNDNSNQTALATSPVLWHDRARELREAEWKAHKDCLAAAQHALAHLHGRKSTIADITKLLDLASRLGRLATGLPSDQAAYSIQDNRTLRVEISAAIKKIYSEPMESLLARMNPAHKLVDSDVAVFGATKDTNNNLNSSQTSNESLKSQTCP